MRIKLNGCVTNYFRHGTGIAADDWAVQTHGFQGWNPETFVQRGVDKNRSLLVEGAEDGIIAAQLANLVFVETKAAHKSPFIATEITSTKGDKVVTLMQY